MKVIRRCKKVRPRAEQIVMDALHKRGMFARGGLAVRGAITKISLDLKIKTWQDHLDYIRKHHKIGYTVNKKKSSN